MTPTEVGPRNFVVEGPVGDPPTELSIGWDDNLQQIRFTFTQNIDILINKFAGEGLLQLNGELPPNRKTTATTLCVPIADRRELVDFCRKLAEFSVTLALNASITIDHNQ